MLPERLELASARETLSRTNFLSGNFLDAQLSSETVDTVLCLSVTKWVHLNWGDAGLKRLFLRCFNLLAPGGVLLLEPQPWSSYVNAFKKQRVRESTALHESEKRTDLLEQMPEATKEHMRSIKLRPTGFAEYLLTEVGFASVEELKPGSESGFDRLVLLVRKGRIEPRT
jgi:7SK snRNA methylphosphate capping enzyme